MACHSIHSWTFSGLVGAFLDLAIAYLLLCASTLAYFASKFLGFFGLSLPCPCNGLFGTPNTSYCLQRLLGDLPIEAVSSVQLSVKSKFPFDSIWAKDRDYQLNLKLIRDRHNSYVNGFLEMDGEASCSSILEDKKAQIEDGRDLVLRNESDRGLDVVNSSIHVKEGRFDIKGKGIVNQRPRSSLRRRRKIVTDYAKVSPFLCAEPSYGDAESHSSINHNENKAIECSSLPVNSRADADHFNDDVETPIVEIVGGRASHAFEFNESCHENELYEKNESSFEEIKSNVQKELGYEGNEKNAIRILEQALEEEHAARAALYLELEKERNAAASAADEAMAMILRLQEEKASVEMEARQYQRIIEEKSAYDAEEMNILKEILVRRETEKHFLEKEVEAYRQMGYNGNQQFLADIRDVLNTEREELDSSFDLGDDPVLMLQQLSDSIDQREIVKDKSSVHKVSSSEKELRISRWDDEADFSQVSGSCEEQSFSEKTIPLEGEQKSGNQQKATEIKPNGACDLNDVHIAYGGENVEQHGKDAYQGSQNASNRELDTDPIVHDVHVIDGNQNNGGLLENHASNVHEENDLPLNASVVKRIDVITDCPSSSGMDTEPDVNRSSSDVTARLPPLGGSSAKGILSELRRNSTSAVDNEMLKIDSEVEWLRERLRVVQEGREKLNFSVEHQEREKLQLQLLEDIARQLREIRQLTEPGKAVRQASLPLPSKVMSKKRRCRSVSVGLHKSS